MSFQIPLHFEDLTRRAAGDWQVTPSGPREVTSERLVKVVEDNSDSILSATSASNSHFHALYTLIARYQNLTEQQRSDLVDILVKLMRGASASNVSHIKICLFLASGLSACACNASPLCKFWEKNGCETVIESMLNLVSNSPDPSPFSPTDNDQLSSLLVRTSLHVLEKPSLSKNKHVRPLLSRCLVSSMQIDQRQSLPASTALQHALCRHEHIPTPLADVLDRACSEATQFVPFVSEFVREIARLPPERLIQDVSAAKSVSLFLTDFVDKRPSIFRANAALILSLLGVDSYVVRNGVVHVITALILETPKPDDPLLDILLQRAHLDVHAFTRSKALQCWISLATKHVIPSRLFPILADMAASRLDDRTAAVRKYAAQLLATLLMENPFGPALKLSHFSSKLNELLSQIPDDSDHQDPSDTENGTESTRNDSELNAESDLESLHDEHVNEGVEGCKISADVVSEDEQSVEVENGLLPRSQDASDEPEVETESGEAFLENPEKKELALRRNFYKFAVNFIRAIETGLETVYNMLRSKSITDVAEALSLIVTAIQFQIETGSGRAVRKMLPLTLARENNIREKAVDAYVRLLAPNGLDSIEEKEAAILVSKGLTMLAVGATMGELACLKELIHALSASREECRIIRPSVITVLWDLFGGQITGASMAQRRGAAVVLAMIVEKRPDSILQRIEMLHQVGLNESELMRWSCVIAAQLPVENSGSSELCEKLRQLCISSDDFSIVEQAINALFAISRTPESLFLSIIAELAKDLYNTKDKLRVMDLSRFFVVLGHVAVKELVRIERFALQLRKQIPDDHTDENNDEEEKASAKADAALELAEKELVSGISVLGRYGILAQKVAVDSSKPEKLRACAVMCLAKLMCVQKEFCARNLQSLFSILASESGPLVRANAITALGDLAFRFPNLVELCSPRIYSLLRDKDAKVRKNALMVLSHLTLNDMIKAKGQIAWMALCILDEDERIADSAQVFFCELARKAVNAIYNILPDTISCISGMENISFEQFKKVISFLLGLMDKERHADGMVDKLCHRFLSSDSASKNRDLAYCISQLNMSSKGLVKLNESFKSYSTALVDSDVYSLMMQAIAKGNKSSTSGTSAQVVEELTAKINAVRHAAEEDVETELSLETTSQADSLPHTSQVTGTSRPRAKESVKKDMRRKRVTSTAKGSSAEQNESSVSEKRTTRSRISTRERKKVNESSDESESEQASEVGDLDPADNEGSTDFDSSGSET